MLNSALTNLRRRNKPADPRAAAQVQYVHIRALLPVLTCHEKMAENCRRLPNNTAAETCKVRFFSSRGRAPCTPATLVLSLPHLRDTAFRAFAEQVKGYLAAALDECAIFRRLPGRRWVASLRLLRTGSRPRPPKRSTRAFPSVAAGSLLLL